MVEADERLGDDEAALGEPVPLVGHRHRRLELRDVVVREVADDGQSERLGLLERHEPRPGAHPGRPAEPPALDGLEEEAGAAHSAQAEVRPERGEEVGRDGRGRGQSGLQRRKRPPSEASGAKQGGVPVV